MNRNYLHLCTALILAIAVSSSGCGKKEENTPPPPSTQPGVAAPSLMGTEQRYQDILKADPNNYDALTGLGNLYYDTGRWTEAIEPYSKAVAINPKNANVIVDMGTCYYKSGQADKAVDAFKKAIEADPMHENARLNLGVVLASAKNDREGAIKAWEDLLRMRPNFTNADAVKAEIAKLRAQLEAEKAIAKGKR
ncbi:MAG: tetratricopeptide repeat protein [Nitrospirota bacterium]|nr:tetratricopeptide repeat protein [Nitrospirota bacterium]